MQNRIDRLENLVLSLMTNGAQSAGPAAAVAAISGEDSIGSGQTSQDQDLDLDNDQVDGQEESETEQVTKSFGVMKMDNNKSFYISDAHWAAVLNDVSACAKGCGIFCLQALRSQKFVSTFPTQAPRSSMRSKRRRSKPLEWNRIRPLYFSAP
jgi:hypothetical protein